jgi:hypothetical protein
MDTSVEFDLAERAMQEMEVGKEIPDETPADAPTQDTLPNQTQRQEETPTPKVEKKVDEILKTGKENKVQGYDWKSKAEERARKFLSNQTSLTPDQINTFIYQRFLNAEKRIEEASTKNKEFEKTLEGYKSRQALEKTEWYDKALQVPEFAALLANKARIVMNGEGEAEVVDEMGDPVAQSPAIKQLMNELSGVKSELNNWKQQSELTKKQQAETAKSEQLKGQVTEDFEKVFSDPRFAEFKQWVDVYKTTGEMPTELNEIMDSIKARDLTIPDAVELYFARRNASSVKKTIEQDTIKKLKDKARRGSEMGGPTDIDVKDYKRSADADDILDQLYK